VRAPPASTCEHRRVPASNPRVHSYQIELHCTIIRVRTLV
jgi:hypothetical protein